MPDKDIPSPSDELLRLPANPPKTLMLMLMQEYGINNFVETGTHLGKTTLWAAEHFRRVWTIEAERQLFETTSKRLATQPNITCMHGNSGQRLAEIINGLDGPALYWLDAHWMGSAMTFGDGEECPVLGELRAVNGAGPNSFVFIDDARLFLAPPPAPLTISQWPPIGELLQRLNGDGRYTVIFWDTIISVPSFAQAFTAAYCQKVATLELEVAMRKKTRLGQRARKQGGRLLRVVADIVRPVRSAMQKLISPRSGRG